METLLFFGTASYMEDFISSCFGVGGFSGREAPSLSDEDVEFDNGHLDTLERWGDRVYQKANRE